MGMALLSHLAAQDFGYLSAGRLLERLTLMLDSMSRLQRYQGHFYNWYDTQALKPLSPLYVSTVDSGNLVGLLLTLKPGLLALADAPLIDRRLIHGLLDSLDVWLHALNDEGASAGEGQSLYHDTVQLQQLPDNSPAYTPQLLELLGRVVALSSHVSIDPAASSEADFWRQALHAQCLDLQAEVLRFQLPPGDDPTPQMPQSWRQLAQLELCEWLAADQPAVAAVKALALERMAICARLASRIAEIAQMDFKFLYDA
ncbi:hypothetical protein D3C78_1219220 [compost metagenome]